MNNPAGQISGMINEVKNAKDIVKEMIQEFELIVTKLEKLQAAMMHHNMEAYSTIVAQSMSILENMKFKYFHVSQANFTL